MNANLRSAARPGLATTPRWPVGTLVVDSEEEVDVYAVRVVVGYKPDGRCVTVGMQDPPWLVKLPQERFCVEEITRYRCLAPHEVQQAADKNDWAALAAR
jgi:hypothetical protein